jgi:Protein of unknown function (DUF2845)
VKIIFVTCFILTASAVIALAGMNEFESCRCDNGLATKGNKKHEVLEKCGEPVRIQNSHDSDCNEMWLYNFGPNEFMKGVCFDRSAHVKKVLSLNKGY